MSALLVRVDRPAQYCCFEAYDSLVASCVQNGLVDYGSLNKTPLLLQSMNKLKKTSSDHMKNKSDRLCYWINTYNLLVLKTVADRYPIASVQQLGNTFIFRKFIVGGKPMTIQDVYYGQLMPLLQENTNALFLLCGGAKGFPPLLNHAISPQVLKKDSETAMHNYINNPTNVRYDPDSSTFNLSPLLEWNAALFEHDGQTVFDFAKANLASGAAIDLDNVALLKGFNLNFNWQLNDTALKK